MSELGLCSMGEVGGVGECGWWLTTGEGDVLKGAPQHGRVG